MTDKDYLFNRVTTANGTQLVVILYEELMEWLKQATKSISEDKTEELYLCISKGRDILSELLSTLEGNSEISTNLRNLYLYVNRLMTEAVNQRNKSKLEEAIKVLTPLCDAWKQLSEGMQDNVSPNKGTTRVTGFTYGKNQLNDYIVNDENKWKKG